MEVATSFREVGVYEIREILRLWLAGEAFRAIERLTGSDRKTVHRYVAAAVECGVDRAGGDRQLSDSLLAQVCERVRPQRPRGRGLAWEALVASHDDLREWLVVQKLTAVMGQRPGAVDHDSGPADRQRRHCLQPAEHLLVRHLAASERRVGA